jgi:drug/metabolite transporter (DMT)-like permease
MSQRGGILNPGRLKDYLLLHFSFLLYSAGGISIKLASRQRFLSIHFLIFYGLCLLILIIYSFLWQLILRRISLVTAYFNRSFLVIWGMLWGVLFFGENLNIPKIVSGILIITGMVLGNTGDE